MEKKLKNQKAITLIALVITIIILLILAGISIASLTGSGVFERAKESKEKSEQAQIKEEIEMSIMDIQIEEISKGNNVTLESLSNEENGQLANKLEGITATLNDNEINGEYKGYEYTIDNNLKVTVGDPIKGISFSYTLTPKGYTNENIILTVNAKSTNGNITNIEVNGLTRNEDGTFTITQNGEYQVTVTDSTGDTRTKPLNIQKIDKVAPTKVEVTIEDVTTDGFTIKANAEDGESTTNSAKSGIGRYEYYIKKDTEENYQKYESAEEKYKISGLELGDKYNIYIIAYDKAENYKQSEVITYKLSLPFICNLGVENPMFETYQGTPEYKGKEEGIYLNNSVIATKENYELNENYTIIIETKNIENSNIGVNSKGFMLAFGYGGPDMGSCFLGIIRTTTYWASSGSGDRYAVYEEKDEYPINEWLISAIKYDGTNFSYFINGEKIGTSSKSSIKDSKLYIGGISNSGTYSSGCSWGYGNGYYRNLAIYDNALSDEELANYSFNN